MPETALITGASSGIGLELARLFAADGSDLVLVARSQGKLEQLAAELSHAHGVNARVVAADLADRTAPRSIFNQLSSEGVQVDVLVNNAGFGAVGLFAELPLERHLDMIQVNVAALTHLTRLFLPSMIQRRRGGVFTVASMAGFEAGPYQAVYFATKAYDLLLTEALAEELKGTGVKVSCLAPGRTATGFAAVAGQETSLTFRAGGMDAKTVARAGYRGFRNGKLLVIPGVQNKLALLVVRLSPRWTIRKAVKWLQKPR
jgi:short-subunit dehydrogenase